MSLPSLHASLRTLTGGLHLRPGPLAAALGLLSLAAGCAWILVAGWVAEAYAPEGELRRVETLQHLAFVGVASGALGLVSWWLMTRLARQQALFAQHRVALIESEQRATAALMASVIAHDIGNVITGALGQLEALRAQVRDAARIDQVERSLETLGEMARRVQRAARDGERADFDLAQSVASTVRLVARHPRVRGCQIVDDLPRALRFHGQETSIARLVTNLLLNAGEATGGRGHVRIRLAEQDGCAVIEVHDDGPGVPPAERQRIFEPFVTLKEGGSGLGLVSVRAAVEAHEGTAEIGDSDLGGACARVVLPIRRRAAQGGGAPLLYEMRNSATSGR